MEKEQSKEKKLIKKAKKIRGMVMMVLICVLMLSAATYAWFTLSNTAKISNMTMTVGEATGLQIAEDNGAVPADGDWTGTITGKTFLGKLLPATTSNGISIHAPNYNDAGAVESTTETLKKLTAASTATDEGYWIEESFYLKALGKDGETTNIKLVNGENIGDNGIWNESNSANYNGTYVLSKPSGTILPGAAVRISFQVDGAASTTVFEPNSDYATAATQVATDSRSNKSVISSTVTETMAGICSDTNILTLTNNTPTKIIMRMWIEGGDPQCGNEIAAKDIITQLKFITDNTTP